MTHDARQQFLIDRATHLVQQRSRKTGIPARAIVEQVAHDVPTREQHEANTILEGVLRNLAAKDKAEAEDRARRGHE